jgi:predicted secreted hydrolase
MIMRCDRRRDRRCDRTLPRGVVLADILIVAAIMLAGMLTAMLAACTVAPTGSGQAGSIAVADAMGGGGAEGFARATEARTFAFPQDLGPHEEFRTEWWYFTGNLDAADGDEIGFQLTIFRHALVAEAPLRTSRWASRDVWFAHFALGEGNRGRFTAAERFERGALGMAGARAVPFSAWVGDWRVESVNASETFPVRLVASTDDVGLDLVVEPEKPIVLQGDRGLSQKGPEVGNASYYYSATRLSAHGTITVDDEPVAVTGSAWLDREWSTSALSEGQEGWDWFAIQLEDGRDLMLYRMRRADGTVDPHNSGMLIETDGSTRRLGPDDVRYEPGRQWESPRSGAAYPVEWRLRIEPLDMEIKVVPMLDASELDVAIRYWEGAIRVQGREGSRSIGGKGFLEMTGYVPPPGPGGASTR